MMHVDEMQIEVPQELDTVAELTDAELEAVAGGYYDNLFVVNVNNNLNVNINTIALTVVVFA